MTLSEGDVLAFYSEEGWRAIRILRVTDGPSGDPTAHVLIYKTLPEKPSMVRLLTADVSVWHAPVAVSGVTHGGTYLGNRPVVPEELTGFHEFLKQTNFMQYLAEIGQLPDDAIALSQAAFLEGNQLCDQQKFAEALIAYDKAISHFPLYYEAIDNRALALMDLARYEEAITNFEESLQIEEANPVAIFSIGECYLKMKSYDKAEKYFAECMKRWPEESNYGEFLRRSRSLQSASAAPQKPWWKKW